MRTNYVCPVCGRLMLSANERCSGSFLDADHPPNVEPVVGVVAVREQSPDGGETNEEHHSAD